MKRVWHFNEITGEFIEVYDDGLIFAPESPLEPGVFIIPRYAMEVEPPSCNPHEKPIVLKVNGVFDKSKWIVVPDYRGSEYWDKKGQHYVISELGKVIPDDAILEKPLPSAIDLRKKYDLYAKNLIFKKIIACGFDETWTLAEALSNPLWKDEAERLIQWKSDIGIALDRLRDNELSHDDNSMQLFFSQFKA